MNSISLVGLFSAGGGGAECGGGGYGGRNVFLADRHASMLSRLGSRASASRAPLREQTGRRFAGELRPVSDWGVRRQDGLPRICHGNSSHAVTRGVSSVAARAAAGRTQGHVEQAMLGDRPVPMASVSLRFLGRENSTNRAVVEPSNESSSSWSSAMAGPTTRVQRREHALMASVSNALTNVVTIDEIGGAACGLSHPLERAGHPYTCGASPSQPGPGPASGTQPDSEPLLIQQPMDSEYTNERVAMLREYMRVYLNWRTSRLIQEHRDLIGGGGKRTCQRMTSAVPESRLQQFRHALHERRMTAAPLRDTSHTGSHGDNVSSGGAGSPRVDADRDAVVEINIERALTPHDDSAVDEQEQEQEQEEDKYSEIDWLAGDQ